MPYAVLCYLCFSSINSVVLFSTRECVRAAPPLHTVCPSIYAPGTLFRNSVGREQPALCNSTCHPPALPLGCMGLRGCALGLHPHSPPGLRVPSPQGGRPASAPKEGSQGRGQRGRRGGPQTAGRAYPPC